MGKRALCFLILGLFVLNFVVALADMTSFEDKFNEVEATKEELEEKKWDYLSVEFKELMLKNKVVSAIDGFFRKINLMFFTVFGQDYDLTFTFMVVVVLWFYFFFMFLMIFTKYSSFGSGTALILSFAFCVVAGHAGAWNGIAELAFKLIFFREGWWGWIWFFAILGIFILAIVGLVIAGKMGKAKMAGEAKVKEKLNRKLLDKIVGQASEFGSGGKK